MRRGDIVVKVAPGITLVIQVTDCFVNWSLEMIEKKTELEWKKDE